MLPHDDISLWRESYTGSQFPHLAEDLEVDVAVVGGGITGLTSAYLLKQTGLKVAVLEKRTVGAGTTGRTTGKVTSQHDIVYTDLIKKFGELNAKLYGEAMEAAVEQVRYIVQQEKIDCEFTEADNYVFTTDLSHLQKIKNEARTAQKLGLPATFEKSTDLPFDIKGAVRFTNQAYFNAQKYVLGLAQAVHGKGSFVFENSKVTGIHDGRPAVVRANGKSIICKDAVVATNVPTLPLIARGSYCVYEFPTESYIVAGEMKKTLKGMYISPDTDHYSILPVINNGKQILLIGGGGNLAGLRLSKQKKYQNLADYAEKHFGIKHITNKWSDRDYIAYDRLTLIGKLYPWSRHLYVGTAYKKWGLTTGTVAGMILTDLINEKPNPWASLFSPHRVKLITSIPGMVLQQAKKQVSSI